MSAAGIPNSDERELRNFRRFYRTYPIAGKLFRNNESIQGMLNLEFELHLDQMPIRGLPTPEFQIPDSQYVLIFNRLSYTHFIELIRIENPLKRLFYEMECSNGLWSVSEIKRQIGSLLYERTGLSKNKEKLLDLVHNKADTLNMIDLVRDPYIFEFFGLKLHKVLEEKQLEQALIDHLLKFM